jgi:hypothetical protein
MFLSPLGERLGEGVTEDCLLHHPLTQPLPQGGEEHERVNKRGSHARSRMLVNFIGKLLWTLENREHDLPRD